VSATLALSVASVRTPSPGIRIVRVALDGQPLEFRPGQAVLLGAAGQDVRVPYSVACAPEEGAVTATRFEPPNGGF
jgi:NAD(P)H-flavin reductase